MMFGYRIFICDECKRIFRGPHIEYMASAFSCPLQCPRCGSNHTLPLSLFAYALKSVYKKIWADLDRHEKEKQQKQVDELSKRLPSESDKEE